MASNQTEHYGLSQWERSDKVLMEDFNADNAKLDAALKSEADTRTAETAALAAQMAGKGSCTVKLFTYTGNGLFGTENPTVINFPRMPTAYLISGSTGMMIGSGTLNLATSVFTGVGSLTPVSQVNTSWNGNSLSFSHYTASGQLNLQNTKYLVVAFYAES